MEGLSPSLKLLRAMMGWSGFTLTGSEGDAEPPMNSRGGQDLVKTKSYVCKRLCNSEPILPLS
ncbi:MAG: hypothetical protein ACPL09_06855, partial [Candidatus Methanodesulfokora sp.]